MYVGIHMPLYIWKTEENLEESSQYFLLPCEFQELYSDYQTGCQALILLRHLISFPHEFFVII